MAPDEEFDQKALTERVREALRMQLAGSALPAPTPRAETAADPSDEALRLELDAIRDTHDICSAPHRSYRKMIGRAVIAARDVARKLLAPSLERQVSYNAANHRLARGFYQRLANLEEEQARLRSRCDALEAELKRVRPAASGA